MNIEWGVKNILASQQKPRCDKLQLSKNSFAFHNPRRLACSQETSFSSPAETRSYNKVIYSRQMAQSIHIYARESWAFVCTHI